MRCLTIKDLGEVSHSVGVPASLLFSAVDDFRGIKVETLTKIAKDVHRNHPLSLQVPEHGELTDS